MRRYLMLAAAVVLIAAACGGGDGTTTTTAPTTTVGGTTATTAAATTTTAAPTTTADATAARVAAAEELLGTYGGQWNNTTFGSSGAVTVNFIEVNATAGFALVQIDLDGNVFGASNPDLFVIEIDLTSEPPYEGISVLFGPYTIDVGEDGFVLTAPSVPGLGLPMTVEGTISADGFEGTYTIEGLAVGTFTATKNG